MAGDSKINALTEIALTIIIPPTIDICFIIFAKVEIQTVLVKVISYRKKEIAPFH